MRHAEAVDLLAELRLTLVEPDRGPLVVCRHLVHDADRVGELGGEGNGPGAPQCDFADGHFCDVGFACGKTRDGVTCARGAGSDIERQAGNGPPAASCRERRPV